MNGHRVANVDHGCQSAIVTPSARIVYACGVLS